MARYRTIKPEFWSSEQVMECSPIARLMFIGLWNFADDSGRLSYSPKTIKAQIFPGDEITVEAIRGIVDELSANGLIRLYSVDGKDYFLITGWHHQKIDRPQKPKFPEPPPAHSPTVRREVAPEREKEKERERERENAADAAPDPEVELFKRGREVLGKQAGGMISKLLVAKQKNIALARAAIEQASTKSDPREYIGAVIRGQQKTAEPNWLDGIPGVI